MASAFDINVIREDSIKNIVYHEIEAGFQFNIRFTAYRGTHLSCMESFEVLLDEKRIDDKKIRFCLNGKEFLPDHLKDLSQEYWFVLDEAVIKVLNGRKLSGVHRIQIRYSYRIPYTGYSGSYLVQEGIGDRCANL